LRWIEKKCKNARKRVNRVNSLIELVKFDGFFFALSEIKISQGK